MDVVRVLAAVLLLGNIKFDETSNESGENVDSQSLKREVLAVASLLGVSSAIFHKGLTFVTNRGAKGQIVKSPRTPASV